MIAASGAVTVVGDDDEVVAKFANVTIRNISTGGALLEIPMAVSGSASLPGVGQQIQLGTSLIANPAVVARVVWERKGASTQVVGVRFQPLSEKDRGAIRAHLEDRRRALRQDADFQASLAIPDQGEWNAVVENISVTGALLTADPVEVDDSLIPPGSGVAFKCQYLFIEMLECQGTVAWIHRDSDEVQIGLYFEDLGDTERKLIERFVG